MTLANTTIDHLLAAYDYLLADVVPVGRLYLRENKPAILLRAGFAPLVIPATCRLDYIAILSKYSAKHEAPSVGEPLYHAGKELKAFISFCKECYQDTINLIESIK